MSEHRHHAFRCPRWSSWKPSPPQDLRAGRGQAAPHLLRLGDRAKSHRDVGRRYGSDLYASTKVYVNILVAAWGYGTIY